MLTDAFDELLAYNDIALNLYFKTLKPLEFTDLENAPQVMEELYNTPSYRRHLEERGNRQTIMLGFSDGTKDGGYLMANWAIFKAKEALTELSRRYGIGVIFFDGRGGPPARGGDNTHQFYSSVFTGVSTGASTLPPTL